MSKVWYPVINYETCTECGACIEKCSHGVYAASTKTPKVVYPDGCVDGCHGCQSLCPTDAISYVGESNKQSDCGSGCSCN